eukprot:TRINITY_DN40203_c0_g1_i1.p1 TRINITY_DN40203_c0_g1~~TRINITY_DN40203_c0_g1_i1.p1  ORF type:complete len:754 (-),score=111.40 TRINITY_DN40203_c0_g1_i1:218-2479(-)
MDAAEPPHETTSDISADENDGIADAILPAADGLPAVPPVDLETESLDVETIVRLQTLLRGVKVRKAYAYLALFEDLVLKIPTPGEIAVEKLFGTPPSTPSHDEPEREHASGMASLQAQLEARAAETVAWEEARQEKLKKKALAKLAAEAGSRKGSLAGSRRGSQAGSALGSARSGSARSVGRSSRAGSASNASSLGADARVVPEELLRLHLKHAGVAQAEDAARAIVNLLADPEPFTSSHLDCIFVHHRWRRRNGFSKVVLRLTLVVHGGTDQSAASKQVGDPKRPMLPEGWVQVTRAAWGLRLHPKWAPALVLTSTEQSCIQTAERLRSVMADDGAPEEPEPTPPPASEDGGSISAGNTGKVFKPPHPLARPCESLVFPGFALWKTIGPECYRVMDEVPPLMREWDDRNSGSQAKVCLGPPPSAPLPVMLVASGFILETLMACMTAKSRKADELAGRFGGGSRLCCGDAVVLQSTSIFQVGGQEFLEHYLRNSDLWEASFSRPNWRVVEHIRGNGRPSEKPVIQTSSVSSDTNLRLTSKQMSSALDAAPPAIDAEQARGTLDGRSVPGSQRSSRRPSKVSVKSSRRGSRASVGSKTSTSGGLNALRDTIGVHTVSDFGMTWRSYTGQPLIYSHDEFSRLVRRAGSTTRPVARYTIQALRPIVRDYVIPEESEEFFDDDDIGVEENLTMRRGSGSAPLLGRIESGTLPSGDRILARSSSKSSQLSSSSRGRRGSKAAGSDGSGAGRVNLPALG